MQLDEESHVNDFLGVDITVNKEAISFL